jgi:5'-nucleotidase / UDP-sugar diphosphatase
MNKSNPSRTMPNWLLFSGLTTGLILLYPLSAKAFNLNLTDYSDSETHLTPTTAYYSTSGLPAGQIVQAPPSTPDGSFQIGGAALFTSAVAAAQDPGMFNLNLNTGDLILPGPQFQASLAQYAKGQPFYETQVLNATQPDVVTLGNHDFDSGPQITKDLLVDPTTGKPVAPAILGANLVIPSDNPLSGLVQASTVVTKDVNGVTEKVGVIGLDTPTLPQISSPGNITTIGDVVGTPGFQTLVDLVKQQVISLNNQGVKDIVVASHLQTIDNEEAMLKALGQVSPNGLQAVQVAVVVAGGNHITQYNSNQPVQPTGILNTSQPLNKPFPIIYDDTTGQQVPSVSSGGTTDHKTLLITSAPDWTYLANLKLQLDDNGNVTTILPGTRNIPINNLAYKDASGNPILGSALTPNLIMQQTVEAPVAQYVAGLQATPAVTSAVPLDSIRANVRSKPTLMGSLIADAFRTAAQEQANQNPSLGLDPGKILVGIENGGGIRNDLSFTAGSTLSKYDTFQVLPFGNLLTVVKDVTGNEILSILERAVSAQQCATYCDPSNEQHVTGGGGQFLQVSGLDFTYDPTAQQQVVSNGVITNAGKRILSIYLDPNNSGENKTLIYDITKGGFQNGDATKALFDLATQQFTANGGDTFTTLANIPSSRKITFGITEQQAFDSYLTNNLGGQITSLDGGISSPDIPNSSARITASLTPVPEPSNVLAVLVGILGFWKLKSRNNQN